MADVPETTISLVTYDGMRWLPRCLASVGAQEAGDYELLVVDNASADGSAEWLREQAAGDPRMRLVESPENLGFARGHNLSIAAARGEFVLLLNQDVELDPGFLRAALAAFAGRPRVGAVQGRLHHLGPDGERSDRLDTAGLEMQRSRRAVSRWQSEIVGPRHLVAGTVFGADGAAPVYRRVALLDARLPRAGGGWEVLDEDFFMYKEDVDLAWRLRLLGWSAWYEPRAVAWHARGARGTAAYSLREIARTNRRIPGWVKALSWRNQRLMQVKNDSLRPFLRDLPSIALRESLSLGFILVADPRRLRVLPALLSALPSAIRKRRYLSRRLRSRRPSGGPPPVPAR